MTGNDPTALINRLISQRVKGADLSLVDDLIRNGTDVYLAMLEFDHEHHAFHIKSVSEWTPEATELTVTFSEKVLPDKRIGIDDEVTIYYLRPSNPA
jgi:hypothetical protein